MSWDCAVPEWDLCGVSTKLQELPPDANGSEETALWFSFHVARKSGYYWWKALLPIYVLTGLSMGTFHFATDNLSDRYATVSTYFLARVYF